MKTLSTVITSLLTLSVGFWLGHAFGASAQFMRDEAMTSVQLRSLYTDTVGEAATLSKIRNLLFRQLSEADRLSQNRVTFPALDPRGLIDSFHPKFVTEQHSANQKFIAFVKMKAEQDAAANP